MREGGILTAKTDDKGMQSMPIAMARHILVKTKEESEKLKQRLDNGEDFDKLTKKYSACPSAKKGGDLGEVKLLHGEKNGICGTLQERTRAGDL